ncbi:MAG: hypothetical protein IJE00_01285 [Clostridia bacterium]|nr:hypothetical protein [Clostridia bacterium]
MQEITDKPITPAIGQQQIAEATDTLLRYQAAKASLDERIIEAEKWYRLRHWDLLKNKKEGGVTPSSAWLFNAIANKHADAMDNFPSANVLPREQSDKPQAEMLTAILPVVFDQADFEQTYNDVNRAKIITGTGIYGVFWNSSRLNGLGDIEIAKVSALNLYWEPNVTDIQKSRHVFCLSSVDNEDLLRLYPQLREAGLGKAVTLKEYAADENTKAEKDRSVVVDWYYKKNVGGKTVLHYVKYVGNVVLYATENDVEAPTSLQTDPQSGETIEVATGEAPAVRGLYDHGLYPFVPDPLFAVETSVAGFGLVDVGKSAQEYIDRGNQAMMENMLANASGRYFVKEGTDINPEDLVDYTKKVIPVGGSFTKDSVQAVTDTPMDTIYYNLVTGKVDELKETTGNRDISNGGTSGVTAASAIAAMQEAGSKLSRDANKSAYRAFRRVTTMVIELIRQFYDAKRRFRIVGESGAEQFVEFSNASISPQRQEGAFGQADGYRLPAFDLEITAQKQSPYSKMAQNELALQFYKSGFFNPQMADQALACLDMMDFDRKSFVMQKIAQNGTMFQRLQTLTQKALMMAQQLDKLQGSNLTMQLAASLQGGAAPLPAGGTPQLADNEVLGGDETGDTKQTRKARERVAESTSPT